MKHVDRRVWMGSLAISPWVHGLVGWAAAVIVAAQEPGSEPSPWLQEALAAAARTDTPLLAFVVPDATAMEPVDPRRADEKAAYERRLRLLLERRPESDQRLEPGAPLPIKGGLLAGWLPFEQPVTRFLVDVQILLESPRYDVRELLMTATWVCVRREPVGAAPDEDVVLLDEHGRRRAGLMVDLGDEDAFVRRIGRLLDEHDDARGRARAAMTPAIRHAMAALAGDDAAARKAARALLAERFQSHRAAWIHVRRTLADPAVTEVLQEIVKEADRAARAAGLAGPLPFGTTLVERAVYDPCPPCGMARIPQASRKLLAFLGDAGQ